MAVTNLLNKNWLFDETIDVREVEGTIYTWDFEFTCNGVNYKNLMKGNKYISFGVMDDSGNVVDYLTVYANDTGWKDDIYRNITITGGSNVATAWVIEWFEDVGQEAIEVPPVYYTLRINGVETNVYKGQVVNSITINGNEYLIKK